MYVQYKPPVPLMFDSMYIIIKTNPSIYNNTYVYTVGKCVSLQPNLPKMECYRLSLFVIVVVAAAFSVDASGKEYTPVIASFESCEYGCM